MSIAPCSVPSVGKAVAEGSAVLAVADADDNDAVTVLFGDANKFSHPLPGSDDVDLHTILISCAELLGLQAMISHPLADVMSAMACGSPHFYS